MLGSIAFAQAAIEESDPLPTVTIEEISEYLDNLVQGYAGFVQQNSDGTTVTGMIYLMRPWRARIEYDPPEPTLIIATSRRVAVIDKKSNEAPRFYPLKSTPLYHLLTKNVEITDEEFLIGYSINESFTEVHLKSPSDILKGYVKLYFQNDPIKILGWTWVDEYDTRTTITLDRLRETSRLNPDLFNVNKVARELGLEQ